MLTPFELAVIFRIQVTDRLLRRLYLAVEAAMEDLAPSFDLNVDSARLAGLGVGIDAQLCRRNSERRGELAAELLSTDSAPADVVDAVVSCRRGRADDLSPLAALLFVTEALAVTAWALLEDEPLDQLEPFVLVSRLDRRSRVRGDAEATRCFECADRLSTDLDSLAATTLAAMRRIRGDLAL